jgi:hypothetical protein
MTEAARRAVLPFTHAAQAERFTRLYRSARTRAVRPDLPIGPDPSGSMHARKGPGFLRNRW